LITNGDTLSNLQLTYRKEKDEGRRGGEGDEGEERRREGEREGEQEGRGGEGER
jgi:hypothetical protein